MICSEVKITTLCENSAYGRNLLGDHGLSMLIEVEDKSYLFDTGTGATLLHNARTLNVDLSNIDAVILSHGHYDHTGGLEALLEITGPVPVYAHPDAFLEKYALEPGKEPRYNGSPLSLEKLQEKGVRFHPVREPHELSKGIVITGKVTRYDPGEPSIKRFHYLKEGRMIKDGMEDDMSVYIHTSRGVVAVLGCAHAGFINTLRYIAELSGTKELYAFLGGTHLKESSDEQVERTIAKMKQFGLRLIAPCHCTGPKASFAMFDAFNDCFTFHHVGSVFRL